MTTRSIHDNLVYAYSVLCRCRRIVLHTEYQEGGGGAGPVEEYTDVVFDGVLAHHFGTVFSGNILFSIEEVDLADLLRSQSDVFAAGKAYGFPEGIEYNHPADLPELLKRRGVRGFEISSSYGLSGWVLAESMTLRERAQRAADAE